MITDSDVDIFKTFGFSGNLNVTPM